MLLVLYVSTVEFGLLYLAGSMIYDIIGPHLLDASEFVTKMEADMKGSYYSYAKRAHGRSEREGKGEKAANICGTNMY